MFKTNIFLFPIFPTVTGFFERFGEEYNSEPDEYRKILKYDSIDTVCFTLIGGISLILHWKEPIRRKSSSDAFPVHLQYVVIVEQMRKHNVFNPVCFNLNSHPKWNSLALS